MHFNAVGDGMAKRTRHVDNSNVDMDASTAAVYNSKNSGIENTLQAKSQFDTGTKAPIHIVALNVGRH